MIGRENIASICHAVNKAYCETQEDYSQPEWRYAPDWQKESAINGVKFHMENDVTPEQSHESWMKQKEQDGWIYGEVKDPEKKTHPCMVPYSELPMEQRIKDDLFKAICDIFDPRKNQNPKEISILCNEAFETAIQKGWHDKERETGTVLALIHSEVSEALEADRKDDEENFVEELADVCIRVFDLCGSKDLDLQRAIERKMQKNKNRSYRHGNKRY